MQLPAHPSPGGRVSSAWGSQVVAYLRSLTPQSSPGITVRHEAGGCTFVPRFPKSSSSTVSNSWAVLQRLAGDGVTQQWGLNNAAPLYDSMVPDSLLSITGVISADLSTGWLTMNAVPASAPSPNVPYDCLFLEVALHADGTYNTATVKSWGNGNRFDPTATAWSQGSSLAEFLTTSPNLIGVARKPIAYALYGSGVVSVILGDQELKPSNLLGYAIRYPQARDGSYPFSSNPGTGFPNPDEPA